MLLIVHSIGHRASLIQGETESWDCSASRREGSGGLSNVNKYLAGGTLSAAKWQRRQQAEAETQEILSEQKKTLFYCGGGWTLEQVAERGFGGIFGDIWSPTGRGPGQPAVADLALRRRVGLESPWRSLPTSTVLWFCGCYCSLSSGQQEKNPSSVVLGFLLSGATLCS